MSEELRCRQVFRDRPAIDGNIRLIPSVAPFMYFVCHMFLSRTRRAPQQYRNVGTRYQFYLSVHLLRLRAFATVERCLAAVPFLYSGNKLQQDVRLYGLAQIVRGPQLDSPHRVFHFPVVGHDNDRDRAPLFPHPFQQGQAAVIRQTHVGQYQAERPPCNRPACVRYGRHALCLHALLHQPVAYGTAENDVILYNQYGLHLFSP